MADGPETQVVTATDRLLQSGKIVEIGDEIEVLVPDAERLIRNGTAEVKGTVNAALKRLLKPSGE